MELSLNISVADVLTISTASKVVFFEKKVPFGYLGEYKFGKMQIASIAKSNHGFVVFSAKKVGVIKKADGKKVDQYALGVDLMDGEFNIKTRLYQLNASKKTKDRRKTIPFNFLYHRSLDDLICILDQKSFGGGIQVFDISDPLSVKKFPEIIFGNNFIKLPDSYKENLINMFDTDPRFRYESRKRGGAKNFIDKIFKFTGKAPFIRIFQVDKSEKRTCP